MLVNLTDVFASEGKTVKTDIPIEMDVFQSRLGRFPVLEKQPVHFVFSNNGAGRARVTGSTEIVLDMQCDRCLTGVPMRIPVEFEREVAAPDAADADSLEDNQDVMDGYQLDTEALIYNEILMNQPEKVLCRPECEGICKVCGKNLNDGACGCDTFVPDPRMAVLQDIFNANKEV